MRRRRPALDRFFDKLDNPLPLIGCWEWRGAIQSAGYGCFELRRDRPLLAHRYAYEELVGPIPDGLQLDHLCRNRRCVNPAHLEPVDHRTNCLRAVARRRLEERTPCD